MAKQYRHWFTVFFVPIFPISKASSFSQCANCQAQFQIPAGELRGRVAATDENQTREAISLYNSLRASPLNSVALNQLMMIYATMKEYDQAASAARDFPQALQSSEQCMATLGRVYLGMNRHDEALRWFDEATARNPQLGEAQYYKALTHLLTNPPGIDQAIAAARARKRRISERRCAAARRRIQGTRHRESLSRPLPRTRYLTRRTVQHDPSFGSNPRRASGTCKRRKPAPVR